jgi:hypothetical protein
MKKYKFLFLFICVSAIQYVSAQEVLPKITVRDFNGKIIVSWQNAYNVPVTNISIQRSYDSSKNFSTIGSVLNPQNLENGFADDKPPYTKMYYRVFISFEGGSYLFSSTSRPVKVIPPKKEITQDNTDTTSNAEDKTDSSDNKLTVPRFPWLVNGSKDSSGTYSKIDSALIKKEPEIITYPSQRIYTGRENNLVIHLRDASSKKYSVKFFDETDSLLFELTKLKEEYLIVEKVNFVHSGWFHFELFENGKLLEKNKFFIGRDGKNSNGELYRKGNK